MADTSAARNRLIEIVNKRSFSTGGETKLVSGRSTTFYFNMKPTMLDPEGGHLIATLILDALEGSDVDLIGGLEMGAVPLAVAVAVSSQIKGWPLRAFFVRKRIVVLEDVTTTGGSAMKAIEALRGEGAIIDKVITVVDRLEGAADTFKAAGVQFLALLTISDFR
jgi:orotate phosphoribosyltransferase